MIVAIHQPNFFPWLGFFDKIIRSDVFVYLDHVENQRNQLQTKRVKVLIDGEAKWLSVPLRKSHEERGHGMQQLNEMQINVNTKFARKHLKTIEQHYGSHPFFYEVFPHIKRFYDHKSPFLIERNIDFIESMCDQLSIDTSRVRSSKLNAKKNSTDLLIEIVKIVDGDTYLCGGGADEYQEDERFHHAGLELRDQQFEHPVYEQCNSERFVPGLSIVDALMNCGFDGVRDMLDSST